MIEIITNCHNLLAKTTFFRGIHIRHYLNIPSNSFLTHGLLTIVYLMTVSGWLSEFASRPGHTKYHHRNGTNYIPAWHAMR